MYLVINLRGEETFSSTTPPLTMYSLIHLDPWWCIRQYMLTPDNVLCIEFLTCEKSNTQFFFHKTVDKMFPYIRKPNNQDIILIYGMFYWSQYCKDYDNFSKVKCCYFLVTFLRKRPKIGAIYKPCGRPRGEGGLPKCPCLSTWGEGGSRPLSMRIMIPAFLHLISGICKYWMS